MQTDNGRLISRVRIFSLIAQLRQSVRSICRIFLFFWKASFIPFCHNYLKVHHNTIILIVQMFLARVAKALKVVFLDQFSDFIDYPLFPLSRHQNAILDDISKLFKEFFLILIVIFQNLFSKLITWHDDILTFLNLRWSIYINMLKTFGILSLSIIIRWLTRFVVFVFWELWHPLLLK